MASSNHIHTPCPTTHHSQNLTSRFPLWPMAHPQIRPSLPRRTTCVGQTVRFQWSEEENHNVYTHPTTTCGMSNRWTVGFSNGWYYEYTFTEDDVWLLTFACDTLQHSEYGQKVQSHLQLLLHPIIASINFIFKYWSMMYLMHVNVSFNTSEAI